MNKPPSVLDLPPQLGDAILTMIERFTGQECHIILITYPIEDDKLGSSLGRPCFITSMIPDLMEKALAQTAEYVNAPGNKRTDSRGPPN